MEAEQPENSSICTPQSEVLVGDNKTLILEEIMKDLTQPNMIIFGVYGSCMSNKINLVAQIKKRVESDSLFDAVVSVSHIAHPHLKTIQWVLWHQLDPDLPRHLYDMETVEERARCLREKIKRKEKILIIIGLNDVKGGIDLAEIGIPFGEDHMGSKILLIAQTRELLTDEMKTQKEYCLDNEAEELDRDSYEKPLFRVPLSPEIHSYELDSTCFTIAEIHGSASFSYPFATSDSSSVIYVHNVEDYNVLMERLDEIEKAVKQPNMRIVGVYGSREGREIVAEQIQKRVVRDGVCDVAIRVMASAVEKKKLLGHQSESPDLKRIQEVLANELGVQLDDKTSLEERASCLCDTINTKGNILIILEDLQSGINLAELGIPFGNDHLPSKIMLLAHSCEVLFNQMNAPQTLFDVDS